MKAWLCTGIPAATIALSPVELARPLNVRESGRSNMRRWLFKPQAIGAALLLSAGFLIGPAYAGDDVGKCSLATPRGQYVSSATGTVFPPAFGVTEPAVSDAAAYVIFYGDGTGTDYVTFTINGKNLNVASPVSETYTLNPDCTGTRTVSNGPQFNIYVAFDGSEFAAISTTPGFAVATTIKRTDSDR